MGRARTQTDAVVDGFTAVLGTRRGSALAQAQRDIVESQQREVALGGFLKTIAGITSGSGFEIEEGLAQAYRQKEPVQSVASTLLRKLQASKTLALMSSRLHIVAAVADSGDPALCPGLTKPALIALCDYLTWLAEEDRASGQVRRPGFPGVFEPSECLGGSFGRFPRVQGATKGKQPRVLQGFRSVSRARLALLAAETGETSRTAGS